MPKEQEPKCGARTDSVKAVNAVLNIQKASQRSEQCPETEQAPRARKIIKEGWDTYRLKGYGKDMNAQLALD